MAKYNLSEMDLRNALSMVAGADPNGCFFIASEVDNTNIAIGAAFGAIGAAVATLASSGKAEGHVINYTAQGLYFLPIHFDKQVGQVIAPEQNFFIPHSEIESVAVVNSGWKFYEIRIKTKTSRKFRFTVVRKKKDEPYHAANLEQFRTIYAEGSRKAMRKNKIAAIVAVVLLLAFFGAIIVLANMGESDDTTTPQTSMPSAAQAQSYMADGVRVPLEFCRIDRTFDILLPTTFTDLTDTEFSAMFPDSVGLAVANTDRTVYVVVRAWEAGELQVDADALKAEYAKDGKVLSAELQTRNGLQVAEVKAVESDGTYIHTAEFEADGSFYSVSFITDADARSAWEKASDTILHSIVL